MATEELALISALAGFGELLRRHRIAAGLTLASEGASRTVTAGSFVLVPRGRPHRHIAALDSIVLAVYSPGQSVPHQTERANA